MSDISRLNSGGSIRLNTQNQHTRQTARNDFGSMVRRGVSNGAGAMGQAEKKRVAASNGTSDAAGGAGGGDPRGGALLPRGLVPRRAHPETRR